MYSSTTKKFAENYYSQTTSHKSQKERLGMLESIEEDQEIEVEVGVAPGVKGRISIRRGRNNDSTVEEFIKKYGLSREESKILKETLRKQIATSSKCQC